jgi:tetratricopeptide (TPR) repeat protein
MSLWRPDDPSPSPLQAASGPVRQADTEALIAQMLAWLTELAVQGGEAAAQDWGQETMDALRALAVWLLEQNRPQEAAVVFQAALRCQPDDVRLLKGLALAMSARGDWLAAHRLWLRLSELTPHDVEHRFLLAQSLWRTADRQGCVERLQALWLAGPETQAQPAQVKAWLEQWQAWLALATNRQAWRSD